MDQRLPTFSILGIRIHNITREEALQEVEALITRADGARTVFFVNAHCINVAADDPAYRTALNRADLVLPDGVGIRIAGRILGTRVRDNVNGTDFFPMLCERLDRRGASVFLLGALPGLAEKVANWIRAHFRSVEVAGTHDGYFSPQQEPEVVREVASSRADVLLVAMGVPLQELWILRHRDELGVRVAFGVGGLFDFYSGRIPRAPYWMRRIGLEWFYRLLQEPRRLWRRYLIGNAVFIARVFRARFRARTVRTRDEGPSRSPPTRD